MGSRRPRRSAARPGCGPTRGATDPRGPRCVSRADRGLESCSVHCAPSDPTPLHSLSSIHSLLLGALEATGECGGGERAFHGGVRISCVHIAPRHPRPQAPPPRRRAASGGSNAGQTRGQTRSGQSSGGQTAGQTSRGQQRYEVPCCTRQPPAAQRDVGHVVRSHGMICKYIRTF